MLFDQIPLQRIQQYKYRFFLLIAVVFVFTFLIGGTGLVLPSLQDSSHALVFGLATNLLLLVLIPDKPISNLQRAKYVLAICLASFLFGIFIELIQPLFGRDRSLLDASYDLAGATIAGLLYWRKHTEHANTKPALLLIIWIQLLSCLAIPASNTLVVFQRYLASPMLVSFDSSWERNIRSINDGTHFSITPPPKDWKQEGLVGKFEFGHATYPGISFPYIYSDWSGYSKLSFSVFSEQDQELELYLRINDIQHDNKYSDRFNQRLSIKSGLNVIDLDLNKIKHSPKSREMDLSHIASLALFMARQKERKTLYIDNIQLR